MVFTTKLVWVEPKDAPQYASLIVYNKCDGRLITNVITDGRNFIFNRQDFGDSESLFSKYDANISDWLVAEFRPPC